MNKHYVKCYISKELKDIVIVISEKLGLSQSELLRIAIIDLAFKYGIMPKAPSLENKAPRPKPLKVPASSF